MVSKHRSLSARLVTVLSDRTVARGYWAALCVIIGAWLYGYHYPLVRANEALAGRLQAGTSEGVSASHGVITLSALTVVQGPVIALCSGEQCALEEQENVDEVRHGYRVRSNTLRCVTSYEYLQYIVQQLDAMPFVSVESLRVNKAAQPGLHVCLTLRLYGT